MLTILSQFIFGNSNFFTSATESRSGSQSSWRDKSLCFDLRSVDLELDHGEQLIACFFPIEDIKGNPDQLGLLEVTNLRLIWICHEKKRVNLSIGWRTVSFAFEQNLKNPLGGALTSLCVLTKYESTKYEFIFNKLASYSDSWDSPDSWNLLMQLKRSPSNEANKSTFAFTHLSPMYLDDPFDVVFKVWQSYKQTPLFRHCRANLSHLLQNLASERQEQAPGDGMDKLNEINKLPSEELLDTYTGVAQSESRSVRHTGVLILTNIRVVWIDETLPLRNYSIPYLRIESVKLKQGERIVLNTLDYLATTNQIEFRVQKSNDSGQARKTKAIFEQLQKLFLLYKSKPKFGPESCEECLNFIGHLRPVEYYLQFVDSSARLAEDLGPEMGRNSTTEAGRQIGNTIELQECSRKTLEEAEHGMDLNENEFDRYASNLSHYLDELPVERDEELVYSSELGLAVERPKNGADLGRIWRIEL